MKKALSLLLAVLMLVSLFSGMAFADDDVIAEEPADDVIAEEPAATDEFVGDDYVEAADAYVEEYTDEGSFEAADAYTPTDINYYINVENYVIDRVESTSGEVIGTTYDAIPKKHASECLVWMKKDLGGGIYGNPEKYYVIVPHEWDVWVTVGDEEATCTTGGWVHEERKCKGYLVGGVYDGKCDAVDKTEGHYIPMQEHSYVCDLTYSIDNTTDNMNLYAANDSAIVVAPTCKADGIGHWVCKNCGALAPDTFRLGGIWRTGEYTIYRRINDAAHTIYNPTVHTIDQLDPKYHAWGDFTTIKAATCLTNGTKAHYCNLCNFQQTVEVLAYHHMLNATTSAMKFDHIERVDCQHYVEVWTCSIDGCKGGINGTTQYSVFMIPNGANRAVLKDNTVKALDVNDLTAAEKASCFLYTTKYATDYNTEHFEHHRYSLDWTLTTAPQCCVPGEWSRVCDECGDVTVRPEDALEPIYSDVVHTDYEIVAGKRVYYHWVDCTRTACQAAVMEPEFGKLTNDNTDSRYFTQANVKNPGQVMLVDHNWSDWTCYVKPVEGVTKGHWTRTCLYTETENGAGVLENCLANDEFVGTQAEFDAMVNPPHPVLKTGIYKEDGAFKLYEMGMFDADFTGIFDGYNDVLGQTGKWYVENGIWKNNAMGATLVGSTWYFLANGKVQEVTQLAEYQGKWFYVVNGVIDTSKTALVDYNGGKFVVAEGRIVNEYNGLWQNAKSIGGDDSWYYVANGQVQTQYTGLVLYDGEWFYVENGQLVPYNGEVEYDGEIFNVKEGMVVAA